MCRRGYNPTRTLILVILQDSAKLQLAEKKISRWRRARPVVALLTGEALEMVDVALGFHHHLKRRNHLGTRRAVTSRSEQSTKQPHSRLQRDVYALL